MNIFEESYFRETMAALDKLSIRPDHVKEPKMYSFDEDREYGRLLESIHDDLMDQLKHEALATVIIHDHDLCDTDLLQQLMTATALWDEKPETANDRMKAIHRLVWLAVDRIAQDMAEKEFNAICERL